VNSYFNIKATFLLIKLSYKKLIVKSIKMKSIKLFIAIYLLLSVFSISKSYAQLIVTPITPAQAVDILVGDGVTVVPGTIRFKGNTISIGKFIEGVTPISNPYTLLDSGVILCNGNAANIPGNASYQSNYDVPPPNIIDRHLQAITTNTIRDGFVLEFNFIPEGDTLKFEYVFSSEEYPEFSDDPFVNDVFGFFLYGLKPDFTYYDTVNIALIPETNLPVTINNLNNGTSNVGPCHYCAYYVNQIQPMSTSVVFDGSTTILTAYARVVKCTEYYIKLGIADVGDGIYDSGVFLKANSFSSPKIGASTNVNGAVTSRLIEGCNDIEFTITAPASSGGTIIDYQLAGTAEKNVDYTIDPDLESITILPFASSTILTIIPLIDNIAEGDETIIFNIQESICEPGAFVNFDTIILYNQDTLNISLATENTSICDGDTITLTANITNGVSPYINNWSTGQTNATEIKVVPTTDVSTYSITVTDNCATEKTSEITLSKILSSLEARLDTTICIGSSVMLSSTNTSPVAWRLSDNQPVDNIIVAPEITTNYIVYMPTPCDTLTDNVTVYVDQIPSFDLGIDTVVCPQKPILIGADIDNNVNASVEWNVRKYDNWIKINQSGTYIMTAVNGKCSYKDTLNVYPSDCDWWVPSAFTPNHDKFELNEIFKPVGVAPDNYELKIYNRWNMLVFQTYDFNKGWDGKFNNEDVAAGVYFYQLLGNGYPAVQKVVLKQGKVSLYR